MDSDLTSKNSQKRTAPPTGGPDIRQSRRLTIPGYEIGAMIHQPRLRSVYRATRIADGSPVVIKTLNVDYPLRQDVAELRHEFDIIKRLQAIEKIIRVHTLEPHGNGNVAIVLESFGRSLAEEMLAQTQRKFSLESFFSIAINVAETLGQVHEFNVVHKNVQPRSILIDDSGDVRLIDFSISSQLSHERPSYAWSKRPEGALPYISPEQTGRMNRDLDYRTDFYSLGVTLFEMLTGELPFKADSALEWTHSHLSRLPPSPSKIDPSIPEAVSAIVLKLMAKNAEDRYQSSYGLVRDLSRCQRELAQTDGVESFALGHLDVSRKLLIPQRLYGREPEQSALMALFERVAQGGNEVCMVSGHAGVGKTVLVNEVSKPLVREMGYLIQGKVDQFQRSKPYSALAAAFRDLIPQLLAEPDERRQECRKRVLAAVTPNAKLLIDLVPELELIIGEQPGVPELPQAQAQNRVQMTFLNFIKVIASERPLVIFFDDLHFSDASTLDLISSLVTGRELSHLLLIGAYRSNVDPAVLRELRLTLNDIKEKRSIHELALTPLDVASTEQFIADALHTDRDHCQPLAKELHKKTLGNPLFLAEMLKSLEQSRAIAFAPETGRWHWDMGAVESSGLSSDVVEFMIANLRRLGRSTQRVLQYAACIGNTFDLRTLSIINERATEETAEELFPALERKIIIPLHGNYKLVGKGFDGGGDTEQARGEELNPSYQFQHDRVQEAAEALDALKDTDSKEAVHLKIGRLIKHHASERLIDIVGHLNKARDFIDDLAERKELAQLNLDAGIKAQRSSAKIAMRYFKTGLDLLPADSWDSNYDLKKRLAMEYQQCAYLTGNYVAAEDWMKQLIDHSTSELEEAEILSVRTRQYATTGKMRESIREALKGLERLGMPIQENPERAEIDREIAAVKRNLNGRQIADLIRAPDMSDSDRDKKLAVRLLTEVFAAAFLSGSGNLFPLLVLKSVNIPLRYGNSPETAFAYATYGMLLCGDLDDPALGYEFGKLAVKMNEESNDIALKSRVLYVYAMFIHHWSEHWSSMTSWFKEGIKFGYQSGDLLYLAYSALDCVIWDPSLDLETAAKKHAENLDIVRDCKYQEPLDSGTLFLQMQRNFLGLTDGRCSMNDDEFNEQRCVEGMDRRNFMTGISNYHIYKAEICFFYGDHAEALKHVQEQDQRKASSMSLPQLVRFYIVAFLTLAARLPYMEDFKEQDQTRNRMDDGLRRMTRWAQHCPENFLHLQLLMQAEQARLLAEAQVFAQRFLAYADITFPIDRPKLFELCHDFASKEGLRRVSYMALEKALTKLGVKKTSRPLKDGERPNPSYIGQSDAENCVTVYDLPHRDFSSDDDDPRYTEAAVRLYDKAIDAAKKNNFRRDEAMANEMAARHLRSFGRRKAAEGYLHAAWHLYRCWGARRKVEQLEKEFPQVLAPSVSQSSDGPSLDMDSVMEASRAISSVMVLERLWTTTMRIMLQNAGGQRGCFVVPKDGGYAIVGLSDVSDVDPEPASSSKSIPLDSAKGAHLLPISLICDVLRKKKPVVLHDAAHAWPFSRDACFHARKPQSVLCIPLVRHGKFEGAIYMENSLAAGVFTEDRIEVMKLLAAQASISIENAKLYEDQRHLIEAQRRFIPRQFLESLGHHDIGHVALGDYVAKEMSIMFADLRDFTPLAERLEARAVIELLNHYFASVVGPINASVVGPINASVGGQNNERRGFIDSFAGDEIKALFDGSAVESSADKAVHAGIEMWQKIDELNRRCADFGHPELRMGIGVNTGNVVLGTVGGRNRIQCSVVGDAVNLASRIEQLNKIYNSRFLISGATKDRLTKPADFNIRRIDRVAVKGKNAAIDIYEVIDAEGKGAERYDAKVATCGDVDSAMKKYFDGDFAAALADFERVSREQPKERDPIPELFAKRCKRYIHAPPEDWAGFEKLISK